MATDDTNSLIEQRKAKLAALRAKGIDPFKNKFTPAETCADARANYVEGREVALAGRITAHREMGKSQFIDITDGSGPKGSSRMQVYAQKNVLGEEQWSIFTHLGARQPIDEALVLRLHRRQYFWFGGFHILVS